MTAKERLGGPRSLNARQAAARLGVKVETIYAYVSRGLLERRSSADGRTSVFDARAVERLARRRRGGTRAGGLSVVLGTALTSIEEDRLAYRGRDVAHLCEHVPFEEVAAWLWSGDAAWIEGRADWLPWAASEDALRVAQHVQSALPDGTPSADRIRAIVSAAGPCDPLRFDLDPQTVMRCARELITVEVEGLPERTPVDAGRLERPGREPLSRSMAARLWSRLCDQPASARGIATLDASLVLLADHGLAASTFAARVAASVRADPYSIVATGLGAVSGALHGAASASVHRLLAEVCRPERAVAVVGEHLRRHERIPGFGHLVYTGWDPRARALLVQLRACGPDLDPDRIAVVERVLGMLEEKARVSPNIDFVLGAFTFAAGMDEGAGEAIFAVARSAGWIAHALEEYEEPALRLRPRAHYVGPAPE